MTKLDGEELKRRLEFSERKRTLLQKLLAQRTVEEDAVLWSMADLMTLLLIFFILFYSHMVGRTVSATDVSPSDQSVLPVEKPSISQELIGSKYSVEPQETRAPQPIEPQETEKRDESLEQLRREVLSTLDEVQHSAVSVRWDQRRLVLVLGERITFEVGEADLLEDFQPTLRRIAGFIASRQGYEVVVSGHTDNTPMHTALFPSNWELSASRAVNVAKFLIENGVDSRRVYIQGYSEYRPLYENSSPENKQGNRRVEITLIKEGK